MYSVRRWRGRSGDIEYVLTKKMNEKIIIKPVSLSKQKLIEPKHCFLELHENYIKYAVAFLADEPTSEEDDKMPYEQIITDFEVIALKKNICGVERTYIQKEKRWQVDIMVSGFGNDIKTFYKFQSEAEEVYKKLLDYITFERSIPQ
jgi:hypothetical protein